MQLSTYGVTTNQFGQALVILHPRLPFWSLPGGAVEAGEKVDDALAREIEEETHLKTMPVRLTSLEYDPHGPSGDHLIFTFRTLQRGGELQPSPEARSLGFYTLTDIPGPIAPPHRWRLEHALNNQSPIPHCHHAPTPLSWRLLRAFYYQQKNWRHQISNLPSWQKPKPWHVQIISLIRNPDGNLLWQQTNNGHTTLPHTPFQTGQQPWVQATQLAHPYQITSPAAQLAAVYTLPQQNLALTFLFDTPLTSPPANHLFAPSSQPPTHAQPTHTQISTTIPLPNEPAPTFFHKLTNEA
ncbi:MAG TPA: NUDIX domain-containing protein [Anaerolineae bacterium]|nr:NUDIX domain-containing protein [Anaerolineae bacterium]